MASTPPLAWVWSALAIEFVGGIALILGLFTRFFAAAAAIEMLIITWRLLEHRLFLAQPRLRIRAAVGLVCFAIALRGGGPYSLDRTIGKEL